MAGNNTPGKTKGRWAAGITPYAEMGYYNADYEVKDTDILCAFRLVPQAGVEPIEAAAAQIYSGTRAPSRCRAADPEKFLRSAVVCACLPGAETSGP